MPNIVHHFYKLYVQSTERVNSTYHSDCHVFSATGLDEDAASIHAGKEFSLLRTVSGKVKIKEYVFCLPGLSFFIKIV